MTFAERIVQERRDAGLSGRELARRAGIARSTASDYELGKLSPAAEGAKAIADALGLSLVDMLGPVVYVDVDADPTPQLDALISSGRRVARWPDLGGAPRIRARLSALPDVFDACDSAVAKPIVPSPSLIALVVAATRSDVVRLILRDTGVYRSCPPVSAERFGDRWIARLRHVPDAASLALQSRIPGSSPVGLYVPIP